MATTPFVGLPIYLKEQYEKFYIGQAITELLFLPLEGDNMIQVKIKAEEKGQEYELSFQILLENIEYVDIPERVYPKYSIPNTNKA